MRLNTSNYQAILDEKQLSHEYVQKTTGLSKKAYSWILDSGSAEYETLERIADVVGCLPGEIIRADYEGYSENVIEWVKDQKTATLTLSQRRVISRVKKLAESHPDHCQLVAENKDGSICAHIPVNWIRINPPRELSEEQRQQIVERLGRK